MMPIQKVLHIYKSSMDLKDRDGSHTLYREGNRASSSKVNYTAAKDKNSFQSILKKTMSK